MRPREIPLLVCAVLVPLWIGARSLPVLPSCLPVPPAPPPADWRPLVGLALLGIVARVRARGAFLLAHVGEDRPIAGVETYREAPTQRVLPAAVARDWRRRAGLGVATMVLGTAITWSVKPDPFPSVVLSCALFGGVVVYLQHRRGHASLLYLPLLASALLGLPMRPSTSAIVPLLLLLVTGLDAIDAWGRRPLGGYELVDEALRALDRRDGTAWASLGWLVLGQTFVQAFLPLSAYAYEGTIKTTEGNAREIRNAVNRWRGAKGGTDCPTIAQLVADHEIDSASKIDDSWGSAYRITCTEDDVFVVSPGPDCCFGTKDDISVPKGASELRKR